MKNIYNYVIATIAGILGIVATSFAISDRMISQSTFKVFKEYVIYRLDSIDHKLDRLIDQSENVTEE